MEQISDLLSWLQANKNCPREEATIRQLLAAQMPETTAFLVRSALWAAPGNKASATLTPSKYEEILKRDLFLTVSCLSDCTFIETTLAIEIADALAAICLDGEDWDDPSPLREKAWGVFADIKNNNIGALLFAQIQQALQDERTNVRLNAAKALGRSGENATSALEVIKAILQQSNNLDEKEQATFALKVIGKASEDIIAILIAVIKKSESKERFWRWTVAEVLGTLGQSAVEVVPALLNALHDTDYNMRLIAACSLGAFGDSSEEVVLALISALTDADFVHDGSYGNHGAAEGLGKLAANSPFLQAKVLALLENENEYTRSGAAGALGYVSPVSETLVDALISVTRDRHWLVRYQSLQALARIGQKSVLIMDVFLNALNDPSSSVNWMALKSLGMVSPLGSEKGKLSLLTTARNPLPEIRRTAAEAFGHLGDTSDEVIFVLRDLLNNERTSVGAAIALIQLGRGSIEEANALLKGLQHEYEEVRFESAEGMAGLRVTSAEIEEGLVDIVQDRDGEISFAAWQSLWSLMQRQSDNLMSQN